MPIEPTVDPIYREALTKFEESWNRAHQLPLKEPAAAALATADQSGRPSIRIVLIREFDELGFVFYTNSMSRKGRELAKNPCASLCFHWDALKEQIRIEGESFPVTPQQSDQYWTTRPRESQIAAWASDQSQPLDKRLTLEQHVTELEIQFAGKDVPRPEHWSGYRIVPAHIEFWKARPARLHERITYVCENGRWRRLMLYP